MLQNRVDPFGQLIKTSAHGGWMGNRGILHDEQQHICRAYKSTAWITCVLQFKNRKRTVMAPGRYTELFFLDEATAFSAGHRPCFECRRPAYQHFKSCWLAGNPQYGFTTEVSIQEIDKILQQERINRKKEKITYEDTFGQLPDGAFIVIKEQPCLVFRQAAYPWSPFGYGASVAVSSDATVMVLTPASIIRAFQAGYMPEIILPGI
ncbi:hypothetical protein HGH93_11010 [Chitinophaga polysaccharea]|uniref:hypothetical protein n=1 Tax=Chitinophaga TaxID=79328 RepID=UPI001455CF99|nr:MULTISPECIES: hypothetical protein [Chitinophaga]NLR58634.1 hypothetical protein [Chitinophaga polysaccharea]NLU91162.1 hypothetical protein [Chitinophaga sp. Ak27]